MKRILSTLMIVSMGYSVFAVEENLNEKLMSAEELSILLEQEELKESGLTQREADRDDFDFEFRPRRGKRVVCIAKNRRGHRFKAVGRRPHRVKRRALRKCRYNSRPRLARTCRVVGCRKIGRWYGDEL